MPSGHGRNKKTFRPAWGMSGVQVVPLHGGSGQMRPERATEVGNDLVLVSQGYGHPLKSQGTSRACPNPYACRTSEMTPGDARVRGGPTAEPHFPRTIQHGLNGQFWDQVPNSGSFSPSNTLSAAMPSRTHLGTPARRILGAFSDPLLQFCSLIRLVLHLHPKRFGNRRSCV